jgi:hydroxyethylthiazole kinase-like uncharacterized protein yjeF
MADRQSRAEDAEAVEVTAELLRSWPLPGSSGSKSERGTVLVVGGARQTPGSVLLAAETALRVGAGKVQVATATDCAAAVGAALPEAYVEGLPVLRSGELATAAADRVLELAGGADVVLLGPGLGDPECAASLLTHVVPELDTAVVLDALGTAYLTEHPDGVRHLSGRVLLTPNISELAATLRRHQDDVQQDPLAATRSLCDLTGAVVLSGAETSFVAAPGGSAWRWGGGSDGLATAGSGDVKAGAIAGLVSRGAGPDQAAVWGAYCHGRAGERLAADRPGFLARDLCGAIAGEQDRVGADEAREGEAPRAG